MERDGTRKKGYCSSKKTREVLELKEDLEMTAA